MNIVYTQYFQKSKVFLYPLLGVKKGYKYVPKNTYIIWDKFYDTSDYKLMLVYEHDGSAGYKIFIDTVLKPLHGYSGAHKISDNKELFVFDMTIFKHDFNSFINGNFSQMSMEGKNRIKMYFNSTGNISKYISSFLDPEKFHDDYAIAFNVDQKLIEDVYEVCSRPDMDKETFKGKTINDPFDLTNISISLSKTKTK